MEAQNAAKTREAQIAAAIAADKTTVSDADTTFAGNITAATGTSSNKSGSVPKKKGPKAKLTAKEKKERSVSCLRSVSLRAELQHFVIRLKPNG